MSPAFAGDATKTAVQSNTMRRMQRALPICIAHVLKDGGIDVAEIDECVRHVAGFCWRRHEDGSAEQHDAAHATSPSDLHSACPQGWWDRCCGDRRMRPACRRLLLETPRRRQCRATRCGACNEPFRSA